MSSLFISKSDRFIPIHLVSPKNLDALKARLGAPASAILATLGFKAKHGQMELLSNAAGEIEHVIFGLGNNNHDRPAMSHANLARTLPAGDYVLEGEIEDGELAAIGWGIGAYQFSKYKKMRTDLPKLKLPEGVDEAAVMRAVNASNLVRDLINTPTNDMGPEQLEVEFRSLAKAGGAEVNVVKGEDLLAQNFPLIHAVGRASHVAPRLLELNWGNANHPKVTLVGKGVCYDTGGLSIKPTGGMAIMKKDMGGGANVMGLAQMIMDAKLPISLQVLVPAVENAISGNSYRPGDVLSSRKGFSVEIGNTDAEGRLVLADALSYGDEREPELMVDFATLTGAARVALGPDLPPFYSEDSALVNDLVASSETLQDPLWPMPMWHPYRSGLNSKIADIHHISPNGFAGSVIAALFLNAFVERAKSYLHLDIYGWCPASKPWCPQGGDAQGIRALFDVLQKRYS